MTTPKLNDIAYAATNYDEMSFRISRINVCFVNAIRRTILSDIPTVVFCEVAIEENTGRLHNELLKHRLQCIPVFACGDTVEAMARFCEKYELVVDMTNETADLFEVTTEHFMLRDKTTGAFLDPDEQRRHFPADPVTKDFIAFARLRPKIGHFDDGGGGGGDNDDGEEEEEGGGRREEDVGGSSGSGGGGIAGRGGGARRRSSKNMMFFEKSIPAEKIKFTAQLGSSCARKNACYNVVSKCTFTNTLHEENIHAEWLKRETAMRDAATDAVTEDDVRMARKNFELLDANRYFVPDSFKMKIKSLGMMSGVMLVKVACEILLFRVNQLESSMCARYPELVTESQNTIENCFDVQLEHEDHTLGKMIEYVGYEKYYRIGRRTAQAGGGGTGGGGGGTGGGGTGGGTDDDDDDAYDDDTQKLLNYIGFRKFHPHDDHSVLRIGFCNPTSKEDVLSVFKGIVQELKKVVSRTFRLFEE